MKYLILFTVVSQLIFAQAVENTSNPCNDPILLKAKKEGIKSLSLKDLYKYYKLRQSCKKSGGELYISQIEQAEFERDYERSKNMVSFTSTYSICVTVIVGYFYFGKIFAPTS